MNFEILYGLLLSRITVRYRGSLTGVVWVLFQPVTLFLVQLWVFGRVLAVDHSRYSFYLASGFLPWHFFQQSIGMGTGTFLAYARLIQTVTVAPLHYLVAVLVDTFMSFLLSFIFILAGLYLYWPASFDVIGVVKLILALIPLGIGTFFVVWLCAMSQVFFRDTALIMPFLLNVLFVLTPIFYSVEGLPSRFVEILKWNPLYLWLSPFRLALLDPHSTEFYGSLILATGVSLLFGIPAVILWKKCNHALIAKL